MSVGNAVQDRDADKVVQKKAGRISISSVIVALAVLWVIPFVATILFRATHVAFLSDDWGPLADSIWKHCLLPNPIVYRPGAMVLFCLIQHVFGQRAFWFHAVYLLFAVANVVLVGLVGKTLTGRRFAGVVAALLFVSYPFATETIYWIAGSMYYLPMLTFFLIGTLLVLDAARHTLTRGRAILIAIAYALALSFHNQMPIALPIWAILWYSQYVHTGLKERLECRSRWFALFGFAVIYTLLVAIITVLGSLYGFVTHVSLRERIISYARMHYIVMGIDVIHTDARWLLPTLLLIALISFVSVVMLKGRHGRYAAFVLALQMSFIPVVTLASIQSRYFYFPAAIMSVLAGSLTMVLRSRLESALTQSVSERLASTLATAVVCCGLVSATTFGLAFEKTQAKPWLAASKVSEAILNQVTDIVTAQGDGLRKVVLCNPPDSAPGAWSNGGYIFRNDLSLAVRIRLRARGLTPKVVECGRIASNEPILSHSQMERLAAEPQTLVLDCSFTNAQVCRVGE